MTYSVLSPPKLVEDNCEQREKKQRETEWAGAYLNYFGFFSRPGKVEKLLAGQWWDWGCWVWGAGSPYPQREEEGGSMPVHPG